MVDTDRVRELLAQARTSCPFERERAEKRLDVLADSIRYDGVHLEGENGADRDDVLRDLSSRGCSSFY